MTPQARIQAVAGLGFTERQARFPVLVMRHAGLCVPRQYAAFAGVAHGGAKTNAFFDRLARDGYAVACGCVHNRARLYHVRHKPLYGAIGEAESQYRRPVPAGRVLERLMRLDGVLTSPDLDWLSTRTEKAAYLASLRPNLQREGPAAGAAWLTSRRGPMPNLATFPIGLDDTGQPVFLYVATDPLIDEFRAYVQEQAGFLCKLGAWTLRVVLPRPVEPRREAFHAVIHEELRTPLHPATIRELKWYFEQRREAAGDPVPSYVRALLERGAELFGTPRFTLLFRRWLKEGDQVFEAVSSAAMAEALASGAGRVETFVLPHAYAHLSPLVARPVSAAQGVEKGAGGREEAPTRS